MPEAQVRIRHYVPADRAAVEACVVEMQDAERALVPELREGRAMAATYATAMLAGAGAHEGLVLVAEVDGAVVGLVGVAIERGEDLLESTVNEVGHVTDLVVLPAHRGRGIGRALLAAAEAHAAAAGMPYLTIDVLAANQAARALYAKAGFSEHLIALRKPLPPPA